MGILCPSSLDKSRTDNQAMKLSTVVLALFATVHGQDYYDSYYVGDDNSTDLAPGIPVGERGQGGVRSQGNNGGGNGYNNNSRNNRSNTSNRSNRNSPLLTRPFSSAGIAT